ncbi:ATP-dependent endonuclease [Candidatus Hydrogenedentota bacterium]
MRVSSSSNLTTDERDFYGAIEENLGLIVELLNKAYREIRSIERIYIPTLRGLRPPRKRGTSNSDFFEERTGEDYFENCGDTDNRSVFTGLNLYEEIRTHLLGKRSDRDKIGEYEKFLSKEFFQGKEITLIPQKDSDVLLIGIGDEKHPVYHLGDGVQQMIIMTYPVFMKKDEPTLVFIEEPELYLHPGMQTRLLELFTQAPEFANCQVFMATHSNHFLDMTLEMDSISLFRFSKKPSSDSEGNSKPEFLIENTCRADFELLRDLGVRNSSVFLTNCTIWVEGISDRIYLRKYLELYQKNFGDGQQLFREDVHYSIAEYAGSNLSHWLFSDEPDCEDDEDEDDREILAMHLCGRAMVIADKDEGKESKHKKNQENLEECYLCLPVREIENLLAPKILKAVVESYLPKKHAGEFVMDIGETKDYADEPLGSYIASVTKPEEFGESFKAETGTIQKDKSTFAMKACKEMESMEDMSEAAKEVAEKVYEFIKGHNDELI